MSKLQLQTEQIAEHVAWVIKATKRKNEPLVLTGTFDGLKPVLDALITDSDLERVRLNPVGVPIRVIARFKDEAECTLAKGALEKIDVEITKSSVDQLEGRFTGSVERVKNTVMSMRYNSVTILKPKLENSGWYKLTATFT